MSQISILTFHHRHYVKKIIYCSRAIHLVLKMRVEKILDSVSDGSRDEKIEKSKYDKRQVGSGNSKENVMWKEGN